MHALFTRSRAEAFRAANPTPSQERLVRFVTHQPRVLPAPKTHRSKGAVQLAFTLLGALLLGIVGACLHH